MPYLDVAPEGDSGVVGPEEGSCALEILLERAPASEADHAGGDPRRFCNLDALLIELTVQSRFGFQAPPGSFAGPNAATGGPASDPG
jgi:hypothetical protein